jgi:hypothetical protein
MTDVTQGEGLIEVAAPASPPADTRPEPLEGQGLAAPDDLGPGYLEHRGRVAQKGAGARLLERVERRRAGQGAGGESLADRPAALGKVGGERTPTVRRSGAEAVSGGARAAVQNVAETPRAVAVGLVDAGTEFVETIMQLTDPLAQALEGAIPLGEAPSPEELFGAIRPDDPETPTGQLVKGVTQFVAGFIPALRATRALGLTQKAGAAGTLAEAALAGSLADVAVFDEQEARLSNLIESFPALSNPVTAFLEADPDDGLAKAKFLQAVEGLGIGLAAEGLAAAVKFIKAGRAGRAGEAGADAGPAKAAEDALPEVDQRDFLLLGDPNEPLFRVAAKEPGPSTGSGGAAKVARAEGETAEIAPGVGTEASLLREPDLFDEAGEEVFVNFSKIDAGDDVQAIIRDMADLMAPRIGAAQRGKISFRETEKLADDLGMGVKDLLARRKGVPFNAEEALAARRLWVASGEKLLEAAQKAAAPNAGAVDQFNFRRMMSIHHAVQAEVIGARTETARALNAWKIPAGSGAEQAKGIDQLMAAMGGPEASAEMARRLSILAAQGATPAELGRFAARGALARTADVIKEVWVNGLLSSPKTHVVNITSNTGVALQQILERKVGERISRIMATTDGVAPGEATAMTYGLVESMKDAFRLGWQALRTGETGTALNKIDLPRRESVSAAAFNLDEAGAAGRVVDLLGNTFRVPGRLLGAEDEFFKTIGYRMELHASSLRQAVSEGLDGEALIARTRELAANPPENLRIRAADAALYNTFTNEPGRFGQAVMKLRAADQPMSPVPFVLPFVRTPINIARYAFERTPFAPLVKQWRDDVAAGGARRDLALARMATGSTVMLIALDLADSGQISGRGPPEPGQAEAMRRQGWQPYAFKFQGQWVSYNRLDPFGMTMGFAADIAESLKRGEIDEDEVDEWQEVVAMAVAAVGQVTINKTYLSGLAEFVDFMSHPDRYTAGYVNNFAGSFTPFTALSGAVATAVDPTLRQADTPLEAVSKRIFFLAGNLQPRRDLWGETIRLESGLGKTYDFFSPASARPIAESPIDREIVRLNADVRRIRRKTTFQGVDVNFRQWPEVYGAYQELAGNALKHPAWGRGARDLLDAVVAGKHPLSPIYRLSTEGKDGGKASFIRKTIGDYRELAQAAIVADPKFAAFADHIRQEQRQQLLESLPAFGGQSGGGGQQPSLEGVSP